MRVTIKREIHQLSFLPSLFPVNCYLVEEGKELTLIDTAMPYSYQKIMEYAEKLDKPITKILLTHAHSDHVGSLDSLHDHLPDAKVMISEREARILMGDHSIDKPEEPYELKGGLPKNIRTKPDVWLQEGDHVGSLDCIALPGHTPGQFGFLDKRSHTLIAGDAFQTRGGFAISGQLKLLFPFPSLATWNKEEAIETAVKVENLNVKILAVGHGKMLERPDIKSLLK